MLIPPPPRPKNEREKYMLKKYEEVQRTGGTQEEALWNIARELSRKNDLLEIDMLCKTSDTLRQWSSPNARSMAEELAYSAHKKITDICGRQGGAL